MDSLVVSKLSVAIAGKAILIDLDLALVPKGLVAVIGPNGAGKSTLLRTLIGLIAPTSGHVSIDGVAIGSLRPVERARRIAYLPQAMPLSWPIRVHDAVALGRYAHGAGPRHQKGVDADAVDAAMAACDLMHLAGRSITTLSGGELARVHIARTLASAAPVILVDEPVAALDPVHQLAVMDLLRRHADNGGIVLAVMHDLALAARFADRIIALRDGRVLGDGTVADIISDAMLTRLFDAQFMIDDCAGRPAPRLIGRISDPAVPAAS